MKKFLLSILLLSFIFSYACEGCRKDLKHYKSQTIGIKRIVTLYAYNGSPIKVWKGRFMVELNGNAASFIDDNGKEIKIAGIFTVEEQ